MTSAFLTLLLAATLHASPKSSHIVIAGAGEPGERLVVAGRVLDANGHGVPNVIMRAYQTEALQGYLRTAADGSYTIETIRTNPAHIQFELRPPNGPRESAIFDFANCRHQCTRDFHLGKEGE